MSAHTALGEVHARGVEATYSEISHLEIRQLLDDSYRMVATLRDVLAWAEKHKINSGLGYDCVQARDVAAIIEKGLA